MKYYQQNTWVSRFLIVHQHTLVHAGKYRTENKLKIQTIQKLNTTQKKQTTQKHNKTTLVQSLLMTLNREMRWAYSTTLLSPIVSIRWQNMTLCCELYITAINHNVKPTAAQSFLEPIHSEWKIPFAPPSTSMPSSAWPPSQSQHQAVRLSLLTVLVTGSELEWLNEHRPKNL